MNIEDYRPLNPKPAPPAPPAPLEVNQAAIARKEQFMVEFVLARAPMLPPTPTDNDVRVLVLRAEQVWDYIQEMKVPK